MLPATLDPSGPLNDTIGALCIGTLLSAVLHGFCILQALMYFQKYRKDLWIIKAAVLTVVLFDTLHLVLISVGVYHYVIVNYHNQDQLRYLYWPLLIEATLVGVNGGIVQVFYTYRVWRLSKRNWLLCGLILLLVLGEVGGGLAWVSLAMQMETFKDLLRLTPLALAINVFSCSVDVLIAGSLGVLLNRARTGFRRSDTIINKLILFVITTGLLTTIVAISAFISLVAAANSLIYGAFYFCLGRLYTNSFLTTLNARSSFNSSVDDTELTDFFEKPSKPNSVTPRGTTASRGTASRGTASRGTASRTKNISIRIDTTQEAVLDKENTISESIPQKDYTDSDEDFVGQKGHI